MTFTAAVRSRPVQAIAAIAGLAALIVVEGGLKVLMNDTAHKAGSCVLIEGLAATTVTLKNGECPTTILGSPTRKDSRLDRVIYATPRLFPPLVPGQK